MRQWLVASSLTLSLLLAACGGDDQADTPLSADPSGRVTPDASRQAAFALPASPIVRDDSNADAASCAQRRNLSGGRHYPVQLTSASGETISFEVIEPRVINCRSGNPLVLHGHGFGGSRVTNPEGSFLERLQDNGYAVISIDQRGFGDSSGTVRVMDPNFEGRDLLQILDWAETHLDYLSHDRRGTGYNLVAGATGGSYGGMYQLLLHNIDARQRLDVLTPDITPHDLRYSLNPNNTIKTAWALLLVAGGEGGANQPLVQGLDPAIKETLLRGGLANSIPAGALPFFYYHSARYFLDALPLAQQQPMEFLAAPLTAGLTYDFAALKPARIDILFSQGMRDTLFNFNEAWNNFRGYRALGGDVRLMTHETGHLLPGTQTAFSQLGPLNEGVGMATGGLMDAGLSLPDFQAPSGPESCGGLSKSDAVLAFLNEKLRPVEAQPVATAVRMAMERLRTSVCLSLEPDQAAWVGLDQVDDRNRVAVPVPASDIPVANGPLAATSLVQPVFIPLAGLPANRRTVAGIGQLDITLASLLPADGCEASAGLPGEFPVTACDAIVQVGWGARRGGAAPRLLDEQLTPLRGLGRHVVAMTGVAERLREGEELGLLVSGYSPQFFSSLSRDVAVPAVTLTGSVSVPLLLAN